MKFLEDDVFSDHDRHGLTQLAVDAHVHVHRLDHADDLFDSALTNFGAAAAGRLGVLMLADMRSQDTYTALTQHRHSQRWSVTPGADGISLRARRSDGRALTVIAGRQVVTSERIELLGLGTRDALPDGAPLAETLDRMLASEAVVVVPWGFGKWLGARGALIAQELSERSHRVFVGDSGGRPRAWPTPKIIKTSHTRGLPVLSGTDPLPIAGDHTRVGSRGVIVDVQARPAWLGIDLVRGLREGTARVEEFGHGVPLVRFVRNQTALRSMPISGAPA